VASPDVTVEDAIEQIDIGKLEIHFKSDRGGDYWNANKISF
jgi:hypothetical protein